MDLGAKLLDLRVLGQLPPRGVRLLGPQGLGPLAEPLAQGADRLALFHPQRLDLPALLLGEPQVPGGLTDALPLLGLPAAALAPSLGVGRLDQEKEGPQTQEGGEANAPLPKPVEDKARESLERFQKLCRDAKRKVIGAG